MPSSRPRMPIFSLNPHSKLPSWLTILLRKLKKKVRKAIPHTPTAHHCICPPTKHMWPHALFTPVTIDELVRLSGKARPLHSCMTPCHTIKTWRFCSMDSSQDSPHSCLIDFSWSTELFPSAFIMGYYFFHLKTIPWELMEAKLGRSRPIFLTLLPRWLPRLEGHLV